MSTTGRLRTEDRTHCSSSLPINTASANFDTEARDLNTRRVRFQVKKANESVEDFSARINKLEREEDYENPGGDDEWFLKSKARNRGSLIQDVWRGLASDLAARSAVAIYPISGWWRTAKKLGKVEQRARFSLLMSLSVETRPEVDIYTPIAVTIAQPIATEIAPGEEPDVGHRSRGKR
jgi:hypothetical protein